MKEKTLKYIALIGLLLLVLMITNNKEYSLAQTEGTKAVTGAAIDIVLDESFKGNIATGSAIEIISLEEYMSRYPMRPKRAMQSKQTHSSHLDGSEHTEACYAGDLHVCNGDSCEYEAVEKLAVGSGQGGVYLSRDGEVWAKTLTTTLSTLQYINGKFVGTTFNNMIAVSSNGIDWSFSDWDIINKSEYMRGAEIVSLVYDLEQGYYYGYAKYEIKSPSDFNSYTNGIIITSTNLRDWTLIYQGEGYGDNLAIIKTLEGTKLIFDMSVNVSGGYSSRIELRVDRGKKIGNIKLNYHTDMVGFFEIKQVGKHVVYLVQPNALSFRLIDPPNHNVAIGEVIKAIQYGGREYLVLTGSKTFKGASIDNLNVIATYYTSHTVENMIYFGDTWLRNDTKDNWSQGNHYTTNHLYSSIDGISWNEKTMDFKFISMVCNAEGGSGEIKGSCIKKGKYYNNSGVEIQPICDEVVTSIVATNPNQTIKQGEDIITTVRATYLDGHSAVVSGTTNFKSTLVKNGQVATLIYSGLIDNAKTDSQTTCTATIDVQSRLESISVTPSTNVVYNGSEPTYTVEAHYSDKSIKTLSVGQYTKTGFTAGWGDKTVTFSYSEEGDPTPKKATVIITVKPNLTSLSTSPSKSEVYYGDSITFTTLAHYENGSSRGVTAIAEKEYSETTLGEQEIIYTYSENNETRESKTVITVLNYPVDLKVEVESLNIFQSQNIILTSSEIVLANGEIIHNEELVRSSFDNEEVGEHNVTYTYTLNNRSVEFNTIITVLEDLKNITVDENKISIHKAYNPNIVVTAEYNSGGIKILDTEEYTIEDFDNSVYDREGKDYIITYTDRGVTKFNTINIVILPDASELLLTVNRELVEGEDLSLGVEVIYEDGYREVKNLTDKRITIEGYDTTKIGYQDITVTYKEGNATISNTATIRVRALLRVVVPIEMLVNLNSNTGEINYSSLDIISLTKEKVKVSIEKITPDVSNDIVDVLPTHYSNWMNLGKAESRNVALGVQCVGYSWLETILTEPLYIVDARTRKELGVIKESNGVTNVEANIKLTASFGTSVDTSKSFRYSIIWSISLADD